MEKPRSRSDDVMAEKKLFENILVPVDGSAPSIVTKARANADKKKKVLDNQHVLSMRFRSLAPTAKHNGGDNNY
jgi:hypothetical protein